MVFSIDQTMKKRQKLSHFALNNILFFKFFLGSFKLQNKVCSSQVIWVPGVEYILDLPRNQDSSYDQGLLHFE